MHPETVLKEIPKLREDQGLMIQGLRGHVTELDYADCGTRGG